MRHALWLGSWHVDVDYAPLQGSVMGENHINLPYLQCRISIDPESHDTESEVLETLRHELLHLCCGYIDHPRRCVSEVVKDHDVFSSLDQSFTLASEHAVLAMEKVLDFNGLTPAKLIENGRRELVSGDQEE
ncbi:MAG: hypothetical protein MJD61_13280 [Proteobacteria bacterium]|nr:hypothetical protein [Pseudomonadota bacterium]